MTARQTAVTRRVRLVAVLALSAAGLGACGAASDQTGPPAEIQAEDDGFAGTLVADPPLRPVDVVLRDTEGASHRLAEVTDDRVTALLFGFTHCEDVCPTTMADLAAARRSLPSDLATRVRVVFVTVDPARDRPRVLRRWLDRFDPSFLGLRGPVRRVHRLEDSLYAAPSSTECLDGAHAPSRGSTDVAQGDDYVVSHTGSVYVFAPHGMSLVYTGGTTAAQYASDFRRLVEAR